MKPSTHSIRKRTTAHSNFRISKIGILWIILFAAISTHAENVISGDTTIYYQDRIVHIKDSIDQVKVEVYEKNKTKDSIPFKQVYEGIYSDAKSYEKWTVVEDLGFQLPILSKRIHQKHNHDMKPHWAGIELGYACVTTPSLDLRSVKDLPLKSENSYEMSINFFEKILPIYRNNLGITTGVGFNWRKYYLDNNRHLVEAGGVTSAVDAPAGITYLYSRLKVAYLTFPLLLEWQPTFGNNHNAFIAAGLIGGVKTLSSSKVKYKNAEGHTIRSVEDKGLNVSPISLDYMIQAGINDCSVYAKYAPFSLFQKDKGPDVRAISLGLLIDL